MNTYEIAMVTLTTVLHVLATVIVVKCVVGAIIWFFFDCTPSEDD